MPIKKILVPTDFSPSADLALDQALELATLLGAHVTLLHVYQLPMPEPVMGASYLSNELVQAIEASAQGSLVAAKAEALRRWKGSAEAIETVLAIGTPYLGIIEEARRGAHDLIVMGTHGRTGLKHMLIGSVAERVVRTADCPVLTVRGKLGAQAAHDTGTSLA